VPRASMLQESAEDVPMSAREHFELPPWLEAAALGSDSGLATQHLAARIASSRREGNMGKDLPISPIRRFASSSLAHFLRSAPTQALRLCPERNSAIPVETREQFACCDFALQSFPSFCDPTDCRLPSHRPRRDEGFRPAQMLPIHARNVCWKFCDLWEISIVATRWPIPPPNPKKPTRAFPLLLHKDAQKNVSSQVAASPPPQGRRPFRLKRSICQG